MCQKRSSGVLWGKNIGPALLLNRSKTGICFLRMEAISIEVNKIKHYTLVNYQGKLENLPFSLGKYIFDSRKISLWGSVVTFWIVSFKVMIFTWAFLFVIFATCFRWFGSAWEFFFFWGGGQWIFFCFWTFVYFFGHSVDLLFLDKVLESAKAVFGLGDG